jgi:hypothetical protein
VWQWKISPIDFKKYQWLRQLSSGADNTVIGLVRTPSTAQKRLEADSIQKVHLIQADMADNASLVTLPLQLKS